jgi:hypothetical protein
MKGGLRILGAVGLGVGLMYLIDVAAGKRTLSSRGLADLSWSVTERLPAKLSGGLRDRVLARRVRSEIDAALGHPHAIDVEVADGRVYLRGGVPDEELESLVARIARVPDVKGIDNQLVALQTMEGETA